MLPKVVIAGGGVIGTSTAYFLARDHGIGAIVVDRKEIAAAASGRAGGFLARDWNDGSPTEELTHRSFDLHASLGFEGTDYRRLTCEAVVVSGQLTHRKCEHLQWADRGVAGSRSMGTTDTIAQVHPRKLCEAFMSEAEKAGASFRVATATGLETKDGRVTGLRTETGVIPADVVVLAMGPWTKLREWSFSAWPDIVGTKYHAVLLQSPKVLDQAIFFQGLGNPEVYPRPDGEVYVTGFPDSPRVVHDLPGETPVLDETCDRLIDVINTLSHTLKDAPVNARQACHLPSAPDGLPVIGRLSDSLEGAYVAVGHGCWGILLAPATGEALASTIVTGESKHVDLAPFSPRRFGLV